jgi:hypothetical protein
MHRHYFLISHVMTDFTITKEGMRTYTKIDTASVVEASRNFTADRQRRADRLQEETDIAEDDAKQAERESHEE